MRFDLQLFAEAPKPVKGDKIIYLYRILEEAADESGVILAFTTENGFSISSDADSTVTKDGTIRTPGEPEIEITATSLLAVGDEMYDKLAEAMKNDKIIEVWEANLAEPVTGETDKFKGMYYQGYLTSFEKKSNAEDYVEVSTTFAINGVGADGDVTVSQDQQDIAGYVFRDTTPYDESE